MAILKKLFVSVVAFTPVSALAGEVVLKQPMQGVTLSDEGLDMALYFVEGSGGTSYEVVGTYSTKQDPDDVHRIMMSLNQGDGVSFSLPGHEQMSYSFKRVGNYVSVSVSPWPMKRFAER